MQYALTLLCSYDHPLLYELEKQIRDTFATVPLDLLRKSVESVSFGLQKSAKSWELCFNVTQTYRVWSLTKFKNCSNLGFYSGNYRNTDYYYSYCQHHHHHHHLLYTVYLYLYS